MQEDDESEPDGVAPGGKFKLSPKSVLNIHINLSSLWHWPVDEKLVKTNILREIKFTKPPMPVIDPISQEDRAKLLRACKSTRTWKAKEETKTNLSPFDRDHAISFAPLETGARIWTIYIPLA